MNNDMNQNNDQDNIYQFKPNNGNNNEQNNNQDNIYQFKPANDNNSNVSQNSGQEENIFQFKTEATKQQSNDSRDPAGIANDYIEYIPGNVDEQLVSKVYKTPIRLLISIGLMGLIALAGLIILIVGATSDSDDLLVVMGIAFMAMGIAFSLIFVPTLIRNNKMNKMVTPDILRQELSMPYYYLVHAKTYFTEHYLISLFTNKIVARYSDIVWVYDEYRPQNNQGGLIGAAVQSAIGNKLGETNIVVVLTDKKKYRFPSCNQTDSIYDIIQSQNERVIVGKSKEAKEQYKAFKNGYNPNAMQQNNNMNQNNGNNM